MKSLMFVAKVFNLSYLHIRQLVRLYQIGTNWYTTMFVSSLPNVTGTIIAHLEALRLFWKKDWAKQDIDSLERKFKARIEVAK